MTLLMRSTRAEAAAREARREEVRVGLREALRRQLPGVAVWVYGSLCNPGRFNEWSDADVAFEELPAQASLAQLQSLLSAEVGVEVDVCLLSRTRLEASIREKGERWTP